MRELSEYVFACANCQNEIHSTVPSGQCSSCRVKFEINWQPTFPSIHQTECATQVRKQGFSLVVTLYEKVAKEAGIELGDVIVMKADGSSRIIIEKMIRARNA